MMPTLPSVFIAACCLLVACEKKVSQTNPTLGATPIALGGSPSCSSTFPLGTFTPLNKLNPAKISANLSAVDEQEISLIKDATHPNGGLYHALVLTFAATLQAGTSTSIRPDGYLLETCQLTNGSCAERLVPATTLLRFPGASKLTFEVSACINKNRVETSAADLHAKSFFGQEYLCGKSSGKKLYVLKENSGDFAEFSDLMTKADQVDHIFRQRAFSLYGYMRDNYAPSITSPEQQLSDLDMAMENNLSLGPELFADNIEFNGFDMYGALNAVSAQVPPQPPPSLALTPGCEAGGSASTQSVDDILANLYQNHPQVAPKQAAPDEASPSSTLQVQGYPAAAPPQPATPADTGIGASINKHGIFIAGIVMSLAGLVLYKIMDEKKSDKNARTAAGDADEGLLSYRERYYRDSYMMPASYYNRSRTQTTAKALNERLKGTAESKPEPALFGEWTSGVSESSKGLGAKAGIGLMAAGFLVALGGLMTNQLTEAPSKNMLHDETYLTLSINTFDVLDVKNLIETKMASFISEPARLRKLTALN